MAEKEHIESNVYYFPHNAIRGKILSPFGTPIKDALISAIEQPDGKYYEIDKTTNEKGEFEINSLKPGNYILVVNNYGKASSSEPFGRVFYPGVVERDKAGVISIDIGKFINNIVIQIPKFEELIEVSGNFSYSDGYPVVNEEIDFEPLEERTDIFGRSSTTTDDKGRFKIKILKGVSGTLFADIYVYENKFINCPETLKVLRKIGKDRIEIKTNKVQIEGDENITNVKLLLPFPHCSQ